MVSDEGQEGIRMDHIPSPVCHDAEQRTDSTDEQMAEIKASRKAKAAAATDSVSAHPSGSTVYTEPDLQRSL
ncbi:hypothetical protein ANO14919_122150 [Xylariales sp. No.14919]|nr:hypothetical protein ANO14919_122150 [Xylariales sp. No.14919]